MLNLHQSLFSTSTFSISTDFNYVDLFCGIGGFHRALEGLNGECVFASDIDKECQKTYEANYRTQVHGDITKVNPSTIPNHDILCAGFPCQPFSVSGKQKGFEDTRGTLFFNVLEIIKAKQPKVVFLENVKQLKYHDEGKTLQVILKCLAGEGYFVSWKVLNSKDFGLAQNRERIVIIASKKQEFDFGKLQPQPQIRIKDILETRSDFEYLEPKDYTILPQEQWTKQTSGLIFCGYRNKTIRVNGTRPNTEHLSRVHKQPNRIYHIDGTHPTIPSQETSGRFFIYDGSKVRKMTINECYKLMGFPDSHKKLSVTGQLYRQIGNSVAIPMIRAVGEQIVEQLLSGKVEFIKEEINVEYVYE
jgi:DNA (cytosine-5)-methyltransferase 1